MRRAEHAESFRLHFRRLTVGSLLAAAEAVAEEHVRKGRRLRARRAVREVARLRALAASLGVQGLPVDADRERLADADSLHDRIAAYTGTVDAFPPLDGAADADAGTGPMISAPPVARSERRRLFAVLGGCWFACAAALAAALLRAGIYSPASEALEWALIPLTIAFFLAFVGPGERRASATAVDRPAAASPGDVHERRSGSDRRSGRPDRRARPVERRSGRDRRSSLATSEAP